MKIVVLYNINIIQYILHFVKMFVHLKPNVFKMQTLCL